MSLDTLVSLIDWKHVEMLLDPLYLAGKGELAWPRLAMFKALLLSIWYDLSDVKLVEALDDRAFFRRICWFSAMEATPERTAFVRFLRLLVAHRLDRSRFESVTLQLKSKAMTVKAGTLVYATVIAFTSEDDDDVRWVEHKGKRAVYVFKAHVSADADTALVEEVSVPSANINDGKAGPDALPDNPGEVFADSAYRGNHFRDAARARGHPPHCLHQRWGRSEEEAQAWLRQWNQPIHRVRGRIEKIFGTWK
ncbi:IS5 family transposase [Sphingobium sp. H39-3-25]|uniref:IS5 family transposase n=1 Tax=Sphingobium arseniciresistens TaxID=3030834 RepID=UPI0023BA05AF|nr:IS5 family transposase [Sphingobium arseniciresistens]